MRTTVCIMAGLVALAAGLPEARAESAPGNVSPPQVVLHPISADEAQAIATDVVRDVSAYTSRHPEAAGAVPEWAGRPAVAGDAILIHNYLSLSPVFYYVPLLSSDVMSAAPAGFVTLSARDGKVQAYAAGDGSRDSIVSRAAAARAVSRALARDVNSGQAQPPDAGPSRVVPPDEVLAVQMPGNWSCWLWRAADRSSEILVNLRDSTDVRTEAPEWNGLGVELPFERGEDAAPALPHRRDEAPRYQDDAAPDRHEAPRDPEYPPAYDIQNVPFYYQINDHNCAPAGVQMLLDYFGPFVPQRDVANAACTGSNGTYLPNILRAAHFSAISSAALAPGLHGYHGRRLGYAGLQCYWSDPDPVSDPNYPDRYDDIKRLISSDYPIIVVTRYAPGAYGTHVRVVKGYDDSTNVYIVHDPWYSGIYQGPDVHFDQYFFDDLWERSNRWGCFIAPWEIEIEAGEEVPRGCPFTITATVTYTGPPPFSTQFQTTHPVVTLAPSGLYSLAPYESRTRALYGWFSDSNCTYDPITWHLTACDTPGSGEIEVIARGLLEWSAPCYPSYSDSIGGRASVPFAATDREYISVDASGNGDFTDIQDALDLAVDGELVMIAPGTYRGARNNNLTLHGRSVAVQGSAGADKTIIDCRNTRRAFVFDEGEDAAAVIQDLVILNGKASGADWPESGGAIYVDGASPTIRNVTVHNSYAPGFGGAVCCVNGASPLLDHCTFWSNEAGAGGGAVACSDSSHAELLNCTLAFNAAPAGGGVLCESSGPRITETIICGSLAGGAIECDASSLPRLVRCCIDGNEGGDALPDACDVEEVIFSDPLFCDAGRGAFTLQTCSPCAGAGASGGDVGACHARCQCQAIDAFPLALSLLPARPSPFGESTTIEVLVPSDAGRAKLAVYSVAGKLVRTLADRALQPGRNTFAWDGTDDAGRIVAAGVYFARCETRDGSVARKLVILR